MLGAVSLHRVIEGCEDGRSSPSAPKCSAICAGSVAAARSMETKMIDRAFRALATRGRKTLGLAL